MFSSSCFPLVLFLLSFSCFPLPLFLFLFSYRFIYFFHRAIRLHIFLIVYFPLILSSFPLFPFFISSSKYSKCRLQTLINFFSKLSLFSLSLHTHCFKILYFIFDRIFLIIFTIFKNFNQNFLILSTSDFCLFFKLFLFHSRFELILFFSFR